jgi:hypothetical protein
MKIYCPNCFYPNDATSKYCDKCGLEISWKESSYKSKLIKALGHKRADIVMLSTKILSQYSDSETEKALLKVLRYSTDPCIKAAAIESLGVVGTDRSLKTLKNISTSDSVIPRAKAIKAIDSIKKRNEQKNK